MYKKIKNITILQMENILKINIQFDILKMVFNRKIKGEKQMQKARKNTKGITLIALVITVIVLIILAAITIIGLAGDNGILKRASESKNKTQDEQEKEQVKLISMEVTIETQNKHENLTQDILDKAIKSELGKNGGTGEITDDGYNVIVKKTNNLYHVKDGEISKIGNADELKKDEHPGELEKIDDKTYRINSIEDLVALSYEVSSGANNYEGKTVELGRSLWFTGEYNSYADENSTYMSDQYGYMPTSEEGIKIKDCMLQDEGYGFIGIGNSTNTFNGSFDGKNYVLYNAKFYTKTGDYAVFANIKATQDIEFKDFTLGKSTISSAKKSNSGIIGQVSGEKSVKINNIINDFSENESNDTYVGGIIEEVKENVQVNIDKCKNLSKLVGRSATGGIIARISGSAQVNITDCENIGFCTTTDNGFVVGGIVGETDDDVKINIQNCTNRASGIHEKSFMVGGIIGRGYCKSINIENCQNYGNMKANKGYIAGILGAGGSSSICEIKNCQNYGEISNEKTNQQYAAGITSDETQKNNLKIINCSNYSNITGGIVSGVAINAKCINNCYNQGNITGAVHSGGIYGGYNYNGDIYNCYNTGNIVSEEGETGGIASTTNNIYNCYNIGNVKNSKALAGGIAAIANKNTLNCFNFGNIEAKSIASGVIASNTGNVKVCYNIGNIISSSLASGIAISGTLNKCYNTGNVIGGSSPTGGIGAYNVNLQECYNTGNVTSTGEGLSGEIASQIGSTIQNCYYLEKTNNAPANGATAKSKAEMDQIMDMQKFVDLLNQKVDEYNSQDTKEVELVKWKLKDGKPVFITEKD